VPEQRVGESGHEERAHRAEDGGDATGQAVGADEEEDEEQPDVERAQHGRAPPPRAAGEGETDREPEQQAGRQGPGGGGEEGSVGREKLRGDEVVRAPQARPGRGHQAQISHEKVS
jgi:hypothetical protein